jgi:mRNA interferase MazF
MGRSRILNNKNYTPDKGDLIWINFNPAFGHEQKGLRPALVLSGKFFNNRTGLVFVCPITSVFKNYILNTDLSSDKIKGQVLIYQMKSLDWKNRKIKFIENVDEDILNDVKAKISAVLEL